MKAVIGMWFGMAIAFAIVIIVDDNRELGCRWLDKGLVAWTNVVKLP